jgi:hypothetical protein
MGKLKRIWQSDIGEDIVTSNHVVHTFRISDSDDPDIYAAAPIWDWQQSEAGKWVMNNAYEKPSWHRIISYDTYGYLYIIQAELTPEQITFFELKFK